MCVRPHFVPHSRKLPAGRCRPRPRPSQPPLPRVDDPLSPPRLSHLPATTHSSSPASRARVRADRARAQRAFVCPRRRPLHLGPRRPPEVVKDALLAGRAELLRGEQRWRARTRRASPRCVDRPRGARPQPILVLEGRQPRRPPALDTPNKTTTVARRRADVFDELCEPGGGDVSNGVRLAHLVEAPRSLEAALGLDDDFPPLVGARSG